jgi:hypothetical protein
VSSPAHGSSAELDPELLFARVEQLARAQCDVEQIKATLRVELLLDGEALEEFFGLEPVRAWVETCALAGQGALQERMWQVATELVDQPVGATMARWLSVNYLGHFKSDVAAEIRRILAQLRSDPAAQAHLLGRALALVGPEVANA